MKGIQIAYDEHFEKKCRFASEVGFKYIAVNFHDMPNTEDSDFDYALTHIPSILKKYNLEAVQTHLYCYHPYLSSEKVDEKTEHRIMREIEVSGKIGAKWCVWHPRYYVTDGYNEEKTIKISVERISGYLKQAKLYNTGIAIENLHSDMCCADYKELARLHDCFDQDNIGICYDFGHAHLKGFDQVEAIEFLGERIKCTHIHNNFGHNTDYHHPPDIGQIKWEPIMKALKEIGYSGPYTLETHCLYPDDDIMLKDFADHNFKCLQYLQRLMNK